MVTVYPRAFKRRPKDAAVMPFPRPDTTPPVTNTYLTAITSSLELIFKNTVGLYNVSIKKYR